MAMSGKFELSSGSPDRPLYTSGQRGALLAAQLDRSGSFRETLENQILSSMPSMSRSSSVAAPGDVSKFFQCLRFDPKVVAADHKSNRQGDFKRHINVALGLSADESPTPLSKGKLLPSPIPEEIKRVKAGLRDCSVKARERVKTFNEALSVFNKFFPSIPSKKRSRSESFSNDRPNALISGDRSVLSPTIGKMGMHNSTAGGLEFEQQKSEERPKSAIPNKRTRTSLVDTDIRNNAQVRQPGNADRDKEMLRVSTSGSVQGEDRTLSGGVDGWEKTKMKKKRSGIKADVSPSISSTKLEGHREFKQGIHQRTVSDTRSRLSNDAHGFRSGIANGSVGVGKPEGISLQSGLGPRLSVPRTDLDSSSLLNDRRDRPVAPDKERVNLRAANKMSVRDEYNSASPTSSTKMNASIRGPRSGTGAAPKLSPVIQRAMALNEWEFSHCTNKPPTHGGATNRKRTASPRSSSPPVVHWASQRPQKSSRTARRTNIVPIISSNDETPSVDTTSDVAGNEIESGFARRFSSSSPQQIKLKGDALSSAALSESEESGAAEIKSKEKVKRSNEIDEKAGQNVQKVSTLVLPSRKNKLMTGEDIGDGIRRQGRTGRGITSTRSLMPMTVEKFGNVRTAKQLRSARLGLDKTESKAGRPPTRKLTDRKAYARQKHAAINAAADVLVGTEDGHEELVAAVNALIGSAHAFTNSFWRQMEPFLGFVSDGDIAYLKLQGNYELTRLGSTPLPFVADGCSTIPNECGLVEQERDGRIAARTSTDEILSQQLLLDTRDNNVIPLCQRFLAALIPEEDSDSGNEDLQFDVYGTGLKMGGELGTNDLSHIVNFQSTGHASFNGYRTSGRPEYDNPETDMLGNTGISSTFGMNDTFPDKPMPDMVCSEFQYESMKINEKLFLEAQSIGIFLEPMPDITQMDDDEICEDISKLEEKLNGQVSRKKVLLDKLLEAASETRTLQEKEFEQNALDKLVTMAYEKYMSCWGPNATGGKSSGNKMTKLAALAFVKRTLDRCHKFEDTGKSCFDEPMLRDIFLSGSSRLNTARLVDTPTDSESGKPCTNSSTRLLEGRTSGQNGERDAIDLLPPPNRLSDQTTVKDDSWSNRAKKRELLLEDVVGGTIGASSAMPGIGCSLSSSTKGKRSERDRDGKGLGREVLSRNGTNKIGRPISNVKGERKLKIKPKQKTTQLSISVNGILGEMSEQPKPSTSISKSNEITTNDNAKEKDDFGLDVLDELQLPGQDLGSWLNIDDDGLQDHDFMGLEIPMDDLSDLNMMV
ncbi:SAGA complex subunit 2A [Hibiscus trionum]|uniref:SAGA complex subunit 2A n=1 Tax=Hibiscus trionum TaxID=183268 RepID=A0A9W7J3M9_HIBTR|nr:SAGA complex subunit 2A [Hibiscus trionum]